MARPLKPIDWNIVEKKMHAGCSGIEIAADFYIDRDTFYDRFKKEYGKSFSDYSAEFHCIGKGNIRFRQYSKAMEGNPQMLILLGKLWLDQKENDNGNVEMNLSKLISLIEAGMLTQKDEIKE